LWGTTTNVFRAAAPADAKPAPTDALQTLPHPHLFNETSWDRARGNTEACPVASATRTASGNSATLTNHNARGVIFTVKVTAVSGTSPTLSIRLLGSIGGVLWVELLVSGTITATGEYDYCCYPGAGSAALEEILVTRPFPLPRSYLYYWAIGGTSPSFTFEIRNSLVV